MSENKDYLNMPDKNGNIHIAEDVVAAIAIGAAKEAEGVHAVAPANALPDFMKKVASRGVRVTMKDDAMIVDLFLVVEYGVVIPDVAAKVQNSVSTAIESMTGYGVHQVNVHVVGVHLD